VTGFRRRVVVPALVLAASFAGLSVAPDQQKGAAPLPARLSDQEFWRLSAELSEPNGFFRSENLVSNEHTFQYVVPALRRAVRPGGVYLGVAPDQNFTYINAIRPRMAFIVDIRRGNLLEHLMYKALFELSADRAEFLSRLFSKPRPPHLGPRSTVTELFSAYDRTDTLKELYAENLAAVEHHLLKRHGFTLSAADVEQFEGIYWAFFWEGPSLRYSTSPSGLGGRGYGGNFPTYEELMLQTDWDGENHGYLASEENFRFIKGLQEKNLIVPVVGNFAGAKALRAVGRYIRERGGTVTAFYVSNVEQYLFQDNLFDHFARNVATLPVDDTSTFIRSVSSRFGYMGPFQWTDGRASALDRIRPFVRDFEAGRIRSYYDVNVRSR
jgi:hypothetical protein